MKSETVSENSILYYGNCEDVLINLPLVDAIITDPPYGETSLEWDRLNEKWLGQCADLMKPNASMWCFGSMRYFLKMAPAFEKAGWRFAQDVVWEKHAGSNFANDRFKRTHELLTHWYNKKHKWNRLTKNVQTTSDALLKSVKRRQQPAHTGKIDQSEYLSETNGQRLMRSVLWAKSCHGYAEHPTQKPVEVLIPIIKYSTNAGDTILDPFMGSGTTGVACEQLGRRFIGIEIENHEKQYFDIACRRVRNAASQQDMFANHDREQNGGG